MAIRQIFSQLKTLFQDLSRGKRISLVSLVLGTVLGLIILITWTGKTQYQALYTQLEPEDAGVILTKLKEQKIPYQISADGRTILIPQQQVYEIRMQLASEGLPQSSGIGFEVFDNTKLGMTEFAQNVNYQRALQGELSRTINRFKEVESSRVHIVMPEKSLFIEDEEPATASVVLKLRPGKWLSESQINGIVHLVSSSVSRLSPENVTVVDSSGKLLAGFEESSSFNTLNSDQLEYQAKVERKLENRVKTMLESALGENKAIVRLTCALDFKRQEKTEEHYFPDDKVVRSEQVLNESSTGAEVVPQGVPGIRSNLPGGDEENSKETRWQPTFSKQDRTVNYEVSRVTNHILEPAGEMKKISVAVIVDGTYRRIEKEEGEFQWEYAPRSAEEMQKLENIVKRAVNFDAERGDQVEVVNIPFETTKLTKADEKERGGGWLYYLKKYQSYLKHAFLGLFLMLTFFFIVRPIIRWLTEHTVGEMDLFKQLPKTVGELEGEYDQDQRSLAFRDQVAQLIANDNEASVGVMRNWLKEE